ncbi:MAG: MBL fold metallo-hydrolase [Thermoguttaceae bacterium]|nr:MBL fold metallo-hydrolase [Thermoguttaceae bacterium]
MKKSAWRITPLSGGWFSIDGGTFFGIVPKKIWRNVLPPDGENLVRVPCRVLLARRKDDVVLFDTGYGGKERPKHLRGYALEEGNPIFASLAQVGVRPEQVTHVVMTHLHFDHAGGATLTEENGAPVPAFPNALCWASEVEWSDALDPEPALRGAYPQENLLPLAERNLSRAFENGEEILPGLTAYVTGGHTRGHAVFRLAAETGPVYIVGELAPTGWHTKQLWSTACDIDQMAGRRVKPEILARALGESAPIFPAHDPRGAAFRLTERRGDDFLSEVLF